MGHLFKFYITLCYIIRITAVLNRKHARISRKSPSAILIISCLPNVRAIRWIGSRRRKTFIGNFRVSLTRASRTKCHGPDQLFERSEFWGGPCNINFVSRPLRETRKFNDVFFPRTYPADSRSGGKTLTF